MLPAIPIELTDHIIDELSRIPDKRERSSALSSAALVCHAFRFRAHSHLFAELHFALGDLPIHRRSRRCSRLRQLIDADSNSEYTGIASHVTSLSVIIYLAAERQTPIVRGLGDGDLTAVMRKLFKTDGLPCSLSLISRAISRREERHQIWNWLNAAYLSAFYDLCRNSRVTTLKLSGFTSVPQNLLLTRNAVDNSLITEDDVLYQQSIESDLSYNLNTLRLVACGGKVPSRNLVFSMLQDLTLHLDWTKQPGPVWNRAASMLAEGLPLQKLTLHYTKWSTYKFLYLYNHKRLERY
ncbi:hypothetical protein CPB84DRAFT_1765637, partial [Gymnopilus junonius]